MRLREDMPQDVAREASAAGLDGQELLLCTQSGIDLLGEPNPQWLILTPSRLLVVGQEDGRTRAVVNIPVSQIGDARVAPQVGSGLLQVKAGEQFVDILRFVNSDATKFSRVAHKLSGLVAGRPVVVLPEDEKEERVCQSCGRPVDSLTTICPKCINKGRTILRMIGMMSRYWHYGLVLLVLLFLSIGIDLVPPRITRILLDDVLGLGGGAELPPVARRSGLLVAVVLVLLGVHVLRYFVSVASGLLDTLVGAHITDDMRQRMYQRLQELSVRFYDAQPVGVLISRVTGDTGMLSSFVDQVTSGMIANLIRLVVVGGWLFWLAPDLALWVLLPAPLVVFVSWFYVRRVRPMWAHLYEAQAQMAGTLQAALSGFRVVKAFGQEKREEERFGDSSGTVRWQNWRVGSASSLFAPLMGLAFMAGSILIWYLGGRRTLYGQMKPGELVEYVGVLTLFYGPLTGLTRLSLWITQFAAASHRIFEVLDQEPEIVDPPENPCRNRVQGEIEFQDVEFGYDRRQPVLHNLSFRIRAGEMIGVVGRSGAGKTTVVNLICRFYDTTEGLVKIDGVDLRQWDSPALRRQIGLVLQEPLLFRGSILHNITYGCPHASMEQILLASRAANCHDFIMGMPEAYDAYLGEGGAGLSGGQRQRLSIARAILTDPRILILDEATSSVDTESEREIQDALAALCQGRTTIIIAHRLSTLQNVDRVFVLDRGELKEVGTHEELLARGGLYARLVRLQTQLTREGPSVTDLSRHADWLARHKEAEPAGPKRPAPEFKGVRFLEPGELELRYDEHRFPMIRLESAGGRYTRLRAYRATPVSNPHRYVSIGYEDEQGMICEVGMVRDLGHLPAPARECVEAALRVRYFIYRVTRITRLKEDLGILLWEVETDRGPKQFSIGRDHSRVGPWGEHGRVIRDMDENRYVIPDMRELDMLGRAAFNRHIYWCAYQETEARNRAPADAARR